MGENFLEQIKKISSTSQHTLLKTGYFTKIIYFPAVILLSKQKVT